MVCSDQPKMKVQPLERPNGSGNAHSGAHRPGTYFAISRGHFALWTAEAWTCFSWDNSRWGFIWFFLGREVWQGFHNFSSSLLKNDFQDFKCDLYLLRYVSSHQFSVHISGLQKALWREGLALFFLKLAKGTPFSVGEITGVNKNYSRNH